MSQQTKHFYEFGAYRIDLANHLLLRGSEVVALPVSVNGLGCKTRSATSFPCLGEPGSLWAISPQPSN